MNKEKLRKYYEMKTFGPVLDFPEAETMETRRGKDTNDFMWGAFLTFAVAAITFMFFGNWIISQVMN